LEGKVTWQYTGRVIRRELNSVVLEAHFNRPDMPFMGIMLKQGDRFVETFYTDRWYNIFEIYDRDDGQLKGYYCNIGKPAIIRDGQVSYVDLALDLWVTPDGQQQTLDEDEFVLLKMDENTRLQARAGLAGLQDLFSQKSK
jgi:hypothetical protein